MVLPSRSSWAGYSAEQIYGLVADVGEYWQFVPWCSRLDVLPHHGQVLRAELEVGFPLLLEHYVSQVFLDSQWIRAGSRDCCCCCRRFRHLELLWWPGRTDGQTDARLLAGLPGECLPLHGVRRGRRGCRHHRLPFRLLTGDAGPSPPAAPPGPSARPEAKRRDPRFAGRGPPARAVDSDPGPALLRHPDVRAVTKPPAIDRPGPGPGAGGPRFAAPTQLTSLLRPAVAPPPAPRKVDAACSDNGLDSALFMENSRKGSIVSRANSIGSTSASSVPNTDDEDSDYHQETYKESYKDRRRRAHTQAERKRRDAIKKGYDDLQAIVPTCEQQDFSIGSQKLSKAIVLQKTIDYIQFLHKEKKKQEEEVSTLRKDVMALKIMKVNYEQIVKAHQDNPNEGKDQVSDEVKFNVFQGLMDSLFQSFNASISVTSFQELSACVFSWIEEHCKPQALRDIVIGVLHQLKSQLY
ncbi:PREDICTED: max-like protein X [Haliaeetus leucocephalus]|uniref:max-like protein X n=2 Tax=Accipitrinae TaxID=8955 RepID=UPI00053CCD33|nr:PREDICTED: max-like protein X [Haliaeetus leucocephalus]